MEVPVFKCRSSAIGKIMSNPIGKSNLDKYNDAISKLSSLKERYEGFKNKECKTAIDITTNQIPNTESLIAELSEIKHVKELSETCKGYLKEWIINRKYGRYKEYSSKQTDKGKETEQDGLQLIQEVLYPEVFIPKSKTYYEDEYKTGDVDAIVLSEVIDNKSSYTIFTFPFGETELPSKDYEYQLNSYMDLTGLVKAKVCYTLNNTPFHIVESELRTWAYKNNIPFDEIPEKEAYEIIKNHVYTKEELKVYSFVLGTYDTSDFVEIPKEKRVISFQLYKDEELLKSVHERILECREWVNKNWHKF